MKLNNKGFAISSVMYIILVMGVILIALTLSIMGSRKLMIDKLKDEALDNIYQINYTSDSTPKICTLTSGDANKIGSYYMCEVKPGTKLNFYVLSHNDDDDDDDETTNLIMDRNICRDGTPTSSNKTDKCGVAYDSSFSGKGPVDAMNYLNEATQSWSNIKNLNLVYNDESLHFNGFKIIGKARLPYKSEVSDFSASKNNVYLYENLDSGCWSYGSLTPQNTMSGIYSYWTMSTYSQYNTNAYFVSYCGYISHYSIDSGGTSIGIRPVITVKL